MLWNLEIHYSFYFSLFSTYYGKIFVDPHLSMSMHAYAHSGRGQNIMTSVLLSSLFNWFSSISIFHWTGPSQFLLHCRLHGCVDLPVPATSITLPLCRIERHTRLCRALFMDAVYSSSVFHPFRAMTHLSSLRSLLSTLLEVAGIICHSYFLFCTK